MKTLSIIIAITATTIVARSEALETPHYQRSIGWKRRRCRGLHWSRDRVDAPARRAQSDDLAILLGVERIGNVLLLHPCCRQQLPSAPWSKPRSSWWTTRTRRSSISMMRTVAIPIAASAPRPSSARRRVSGAPLFFFIARHHGELRPSPLARNGGGAPRGETEFDFGCVSSARRRPIPRTRLTTSSRRQLSAEAAAAALQRPVV